MSPKTEAALAAANDAPAAPKGALLVICVWVVGLIAVTLALVSVASHFLKKHKAPEPSVADIQPAEVAAAPVNFSYRNPHTPKTKPKTATNKIARQPTDAPAMPVTGNPVSVQKPQIDDGFTADFDKQVLNFERQIQ